MMLQVSNSTVRHDQCNRGSAFHEDQRTSDLLARGQLPIDLKARDLVLSPLSLELQVNREQYCMPKSLSSPARMSSLTLERLGGGAAFLLRDAVTGTALLLGCGEARPASSDKAAGAATALSADDGSGSESVDDGENAYAHALRTVASDATLAAVLVTDARPAASFLLPFLTEKCALSAPVLLTHGTRALAPHRLAEHWCVRACMECTRVTKTATIDSHLCTGRAGGTASHSLTRPISLQRSARRRQSHSKRARQ